MFRFLVQVGIVCLAIVLLLYRQRASADLGEQRELAEPIERIDADELEATDIETEEAEAGVAR